MFFLGSKNLLGFDIGASKIKLCVAQIKSNSIHVKKYFEIPMDKNPIHQGEIHPTDKLIQKCKVALSKLKIKSKKVCAGVAGSSVMVKRVTIPLMEDSLIHEQIRWEAEQYIPFDLGSVILEHKKLDLKLQPDSLEVLLVAAQDHFVMQVNQFIQNLGKTCACIDVSSFALSNALSRTYKGLPHKTVALFDIGAESTHFIVLHRDELIFSRDVPIGGKAHTQEIEKAMGLSFQEAEAFKKASVGEWPEQVHQAVLSGNKLVTDQLTGSIEFFLNTSSQFDLEKIYITGGGAFTPGLLEALKLSLQKEMEILNFSDRVKYSGDPSLKNSFFQSGAVSLGLALRKDK